MIRLLLLIFIYFSNTFAQDRLDPYPILDSLTVNQSIFSNNPNKFKKGWNWSSQSKKLSSALGIDYDQIPIIKERLLEDYNYPDSSFLIPLIKENASTKTDVSIFNAQAMHYEVTFKSQKSQFPLSNGTYLLIVKSNNKQTSQKLTLIR